MWFLDWVIAKVKSLNTWNTVFIVTLTSRKFHQLRRVYGIAMFMSVTDNSVSACVYWLCFRSNFYALKKTWGISNLGVIFTAFAIMTHTGDKLWTHPQLKLMSPGLKCRPESHPVGLQVWKCPTLSWLETNFLLFLCDNSSSYSHLDGAEKPEKLVEKWT